MSHRSRHRPPSVEGGCHNSHPPTLSSSTPQLPLERLCSLPAPRRFTLGPYEFRSAYCSAPVVTSNVPRQRCKRNSAYSLNPARLPNAFNGTNPCAASRPIISPSVLPKYPSSAAKGTKAPLARLGTREPASLDGNGHHDCCCTK